MVLKLSRLASPFQRLPMGVTTYSVIKLSVFNFTQKCHEIFATLFTQKGVMPHFATVFEEALA